MTESMRFQGLIVMGIYMLGMLGIGLYCNKKYSGSLSGVLTGNRSLGPWVFALTYGSTYLSSSTFIGNTATAYKGGLAFLFMPLAQMLLLPVALVLFSGALRRMSIQLDTLTLPDYLSKRFRSSIPGLIASVVIVIFMVPYMVGVVKGGAISLASLLNVSYSTGVLLVSGVAGVYLIFGGYMARAYTDVIQGVMMAAGMMIALIAGLYIVGGPTEIASELNSLDPQLLETPGPLGWSNLLLFSTVFAITPWGLPQLVQTTFTIKDRKTVYTSAIVLSVWLSAMLFGSMILGNIGRAYFGDAYISNPDNLFPDLILSFFPNVIGAVVITAIIAAAMSTIDGVLMTSGSAVGYDIYKKFINKNATEKQTISVINIAMLLIVGVVIIWAMNPPAMLLYFTSYAFSVIAGTLIVPIFGGIYSRKGTTQGCIASMLVGFVGTLGWYRILIDGNYILGIPPFVAGAILSCITFFVVSKYTKPLPEKFIEYIFSKEYSESVYIEE